MEDQNELNDIILNKNGSSLGNKKIILAAATLGFILIVVVMFMNTLSSKGTENLPKPALPPQPQQQIKQALAPEPLFEDVQVVQEGQKADAPSLDQIAQKLKAQSNQQIAPAPAQTQAVTPAPTQPQQQVVRTSVQQPQVQPKPVIQKTVESKPAVVASQPEAKEIPQKVVVAKKEETKPQEVKQVVPKESPKKVAEAKKTPETVEAPLQNAYYIQVGSFETKEPEKKLLEAISKLEYKYKFHDSTSNSKVIHKVLVGPFYNEADARKALKDIRASVEAGAFLTKL